MTLIRGVESNIGNTKERVCKVSGSNSESEATRDGLMAVLADHSSDGLESYLRIDKVEK